MGTMNAIKSALGLGTFPDVADLRKNAANISTRRQELEAALGRFHLDLDAAQQRLDAAKSGILSGTASADDLAHEGAEVKKQQAAVDEIERGLADVKGAEADALAQVEEAEHGEEATRQRKAAAPLLAEAERLVAEQADVLASIWVPLVRRREILARIAKEYPLVELPEAVDPWSLARLVAERWTGNGEEISADPAYRAEAIRFWMRNLYSLHAPNGSMVAMRFLGFKTY